MQNINKLNEKQKVELIERLLEGLYEMAEAIAMIYNPKWAELSDDQKAESVVHVIHAYVEEGVFYVSQD